MLSLKSSTLSKDLRIPDYGSGWNPLKIKLAQYMDCWYPAWAAGGCDTATFTDAECLDVERRLGAYYGITVA